MHEDFNSYLKNYAACTCNLVIHQVRCIWSHQVYYRKQYKEFKNRVFINQLFSTNRDRWREKYSLQVSIL